MRYLRLFCCIYSQAYLSKTSRQGGSSVWRSHWRHQRAFLAQSWSTECQLYSQRWSNDVVSLALEASKTETRRNQEKLFAPPKASQKWLNFLHHFPRRTRLRWKMVDPYCYGLLKRAQHWHFQLGFLASNRGTSAGFPWHRRGRRRASIGL